MKFCSRCVLPDTFPGISFDEEGVCNYCRNTPLPDEKVRKAYLERFTSLIEESRGKAPFDVIMAYSGGKDSTYTMLMLKQRYNLSILAITFDNGFISEQAKRNIEKMTTEVGAARIIIAPPFDLMKRVFGLAATRDIYSAKALDRASSICTSCIGMIKSIVLKTALNMRIPLVAFGWSPGQAPISSAIMKTNPRLQRITHRTIKDPLIKHVGDDIKPYFLTDDDLELDKSIWPTNIHPLAFTDYNEEEILKEITGLGWVKPEDTDPNSTNCLLNALANYIHRKRFGFHPYAWEIAGIVRLGYMDRSEGIKKVTKEEDMKMVEYAANLLGIKL